MSKEEVEFCLLNREEPTYHGPDLPAQSEGAACEEPPVSHPWSESEDTRAARSDKKMVSIYPPVAAANIERMFGENPDCVLSIAEDASTLSSVANHHRCTHTIFA